jgi:hypothetical protein
MVIVFPSIVVGDVEKSAVDLNKIQFEAAPRGYGNEPPPPDFGPAPDGSKAPEAGPSVPVPTPSQPAEEDPMEAVKRALQSDAAKKK